MLFFICYLAVVIFLTFLVRYYKKRGELSNSSSEDLVIEILCWPATVIFYCSMVVFILAESLIEWLAQILK